MGRWLEETKPQVWRNREGFLDVDVAETLSVEGAAAFSVASWNCSAINNNPFEYIIEFDEEPGYADLMKAVERMLADPASDVPLHMVFTDEMQAELMAKLTAAGETADAIAAVNKVWASLRDATLVQGFLKNRQLGKKRLVSMPDRVSNTIRTAEGGRALRPTVINACVDKELESIASWWDSWLAFMFDRKVTMPSGSGSAGPTERTVFQLFRPIKKAKYEAITAEEEAVSLPLQALYLAAFDAVMLHIVTTVAKDSWLSVKRAVAQHMVDGKDDRQIQILADQYSSMDVVCLQEVSVAMVETLHRSLGTDFHVIAGADASPEQNQNSVILLKRATFPEAGLEITAEVKTRMVSNQLSPGDLVVVLCTDTAGVQYVVASFHGDSDGKSAVPTVGAVASVAAESYPDAKFIAGMDVNTTTPERSVQEHKLSWTTLLDELPKHNLTTAFGDRPPATDYTSFIARSSLQGQLHKAIPFTEVEAHACKEPKDVVLYRSGEFCRAKCWKDCVGDGSWRQDAVMPSVTFPSDHAIVAAVFKKL